MANGVSMYHLDNKGNVAKAPKKAPLTTKVYTPRGLDTVRIKDIVKVTKLHKGFAYVLVKGSDRPCKITLEQCLAWAEKSDVSLLPKDCHKVERDIPPEHIRSIVWKFALVHYVLLNGGRKTYVPADLSLKAEVYRASLGPDFIPVSTDQPWSSRSVVLGDSIPFENIIKLVRKGKGGEGKPVLDKDGKVKLDANEEEIRVGEGTHRVLVSHISAYHPGNTDNVEKALCTVLISHRRYKKYLDYLKGNRPAKEVEEIFGVVIVPEDYTDSEGKPALGSSKLKGVTIKKGEGSDEGSDPDDYLSTQSAMARHVTKKAADKVEATRKEITMRTKLIAASFRKQKKAAEKAAWDQAVMEYEKEKGITHVEG